MLLVTVLVSALLFGSMASQRCSTTSGIMDADFLLKKLQDNCSTPCFQEGLSRMTDTMQKKQFSLIFLRMKRSVDILKNNKCPFFSCEQPCNQTTPGNTVTFLRSLLETFQKEKMKGVNSQQ
ncbi:Interleukin-9 [Sciurus carolinensis]|uniref:Interleukin-9 n=1 Tax=Sciurus carolinensis TaxID=30640 RepID=A0AA41N1A8_SCICA|nr:Interleukin-9 [Sciurus carolinensis]